MRILGLMAIPHAGTPWNGLAAPWIDQLESRRLLAGAGNFALSGTGVFDIVGDPGTDDVIVVDMGGQGGAVRATVNGFSKDWGTAAVTEIHIDGKDFNAANGPDGDTITVSLTVIIGSKITTRAGKDHISGGWGNDTVYAGDAADTIHGNTGNDELFAQAGDDYAIQGGPGKDSIDGGDGADFLSGGPDSPADPLTNSRDSVYGGSGNFGDNLSGDIGDDILYGGAGNDYLYGNAGEDDLHGEADGDYLEGGADDDDLYGGDGGDFLDGGSGYDFMDGEGDNYRLWAGDRQYDTVMGGAGTDDHAIVDIDLDSVSGVETY
jgi:Ca2+-binding RTX toxin-like protein